MFLMPRAGHVGAQGPAVVGTEQTKTKPAGMLKPSVCIPMRIVVHCRHHYCVTMEVSYVFFMNRLEMHAW